jgi:hypothetical protein
VCRDDVLAHDALLLKEMTMGERQPVTCSLDPMTTLQNRWYGSIVAQLGVDPTTAQLLVPCPPLAHSDRQFWMYPNLLPPVSLTFHTTLSSGDLFLHEYAAIASAQHFPAVDFRHDIGEEVFPLWQTYLDQQMPQPTPDQLPSLFQTWAAIYAPDVLQVGVADLLQLALSAEARQALQPYLGPDAQPADFDISFTQMLHLLQSTPQVQLSFASSHASDDVRQTWTGGIDINLCGLWNGYSRTGRLSRHFAASQVQVTVSAQHFLVCSAIPGAWYRSSLLNEAYANPGTPPWPADANPDWNEVCGPGGSMSHLIASLFLLDGLHMSTTSDAAYAASDQQMILHNAAHGFWPFFIPNKAGVANNTVTFDQSCRMSIDTVTCSGNPLIIGANVLSIARYLGRPG